jgi:3-deoxy-D-manno-octulosonic-acid transferase
MSWLGGLLLWFVYFPLMRFISLWIFWLPDVQERKNFEKKNKTELLAQSFRSSGLTADLCFEFSSEGEYQQVASLIDDALAAGKRIELVFFSPSVEKTIMELAGRHQQQIRYFRYPLVTFSALQVAHCFSKWITARELIMVRYDLFPEFLVWGMRPGNHLKMIWVTFKKEREKGSSVPWLKRLFLRRSEQVFYATEADEHQGRQLGVAGVTYDFRIEQIRRRIHLREDKFARQFVLYPDFRAIISAYPREKRLIMGNVWPQDMHLLQRLPKDILLVLVPHQLNSEILEEMREYLEGMGRLPVEINDGTTAIATSDTWLINKKGILCELYSDFGKAYVGGGFGESVHSILEPLVAGSPHIAAGPVHHRSTEYDMAAELGRMSEVKNHEDFNRWLHQAFPGENATPELHHFFDQYSRFSKEIISC